MTSTLHIPPNTFETRSSMIDVTSLSRPDTSWRFTDSHGHLHAWRKNDGSIADAYHPLEPLSLPSLEWVTEVEGTDDFPEIGHLECRECREEVTPGRCPDTYEQMIPGLRSYYINGSPVSFDEFKRRALLACPDLDWPD